MPESGLFIEHLVESLFSVPELLDAGVVEAALRWVKPELVDPASMDSVRAEFANGGAIPHVCLDQPLRVGAAREIGAALAKARFADHHHADYKVQVARRAEQRPSALTRFVDWLASTEGAEFHRAWTGCPEGRKTLDFVQVQTARARAGEYFPPHVDTDEEGLAAVYQFTRGFQPEDGGVLKFGRELVVAPAFNRVLLFRPRGVEHEVSRIEASAGKKTRFTVTAFWLYR